MDFPLSHSASDEGDAGCDRLKGAAELQTARNQRARNRRPSYHSQAAKQTPNTKLPAGGTATGHANKSSTASTRAGSPPEQARGRSRARGDEVLRTMGGGYLAVTALCTLNRALLQYTEKQAADNSQKPSNDGHQPDNDVEDQLGPAREVAELCSLLASLFRLGSPSFQVRTPACTLSTPSSVQLASCLPPLSSLALGEYFCPG